MGDNRKRSQQSMNIDQKSLETEFSIAIYRPGDKLQSKTLILATIFDLRSSIVKSIFDCRLSGVKMRQNTNNVAVHHE